MPPLAQLLKEFLDSPADTGVKARSIMSESSSNTTRAHSRVESDAKSDSLGSLDLTHLPDGLPSLGAADGGFVKAVRKVDGRAARRRSRSMSIPGGSEEETHNNPLFYTDDAGVQHEVFKQDRGCQPRGPLSLITSLISCWHHKTPESKAWEKRRAAALVELSKRQQAALADKQDTIDMLEWQLEQLQAMAGRENELQELESAVVSPVLSLQHHQQKPPDPSCCEKESSRPRIEDKHGEDECCGSIRGTELSATVLLFEMAVIRARLSIRYFCNVFIKQMEASGYPVCRTLAEMEPTSAFLRKEHTAFVLDSRINKAFFHCFENDSFDDSGLMKILDTGKRCTVRLEEYKRMKLLNVADAVNSSSQGFEPEFLRFCQTKTKEMWSLFQMSMVFKNVEEREAFTGAFLDVAKGVWLLHRLAFSMNPSVVIIRVGKGMEMNPLYVEPVAVPEDGCRKCSSPKVEFMIMPGFRAHKKVIKCQVYPHILCK